MQSSKEQQKKTKAGLRLKFLCLRCITHPVVNKLIILPVIFLNLVILDSCISTNPLTDKIHFEEGLGELEDDDENQTSLAEKSPPPTKSKTSDKKLWQNEYLAPKNSHIKSLIDYKFSDALAKAARLRGRRWNSKGQCLKAVRFNLWEILRKLKRRSRKIIDLNKMSCDHKSRRLCALFNAGFNAENFRRWAKKNPISLFKELGLADVTNIPNLKLQRGFVLAYAKGKYGFHAKHGHIEVVTKTKPLVACSDHCKVRKRSRRPSMILAPITELPALLALKGRLNFL